LSFFARVHESTFKTGNAELGKPFPPESEDAVSHFSQNITFLFKQVKQNNPTTIVDGGENTMRPSTAVEKIISFSYVTSAATKFLQQ